MVTLGIPPDKFSNPAKERTGIKIDLWIGDRKALKTGILLLRENLMIPHRAVRKMLVSLY
jgi:hypothetical protein